MPDTSGPAVVARRDEASAGVGEGHAAEPSDGRRARSVRTQTSILDAALDLIVELDRIPSVEEVADRAEVSVRSVFRHFATLDDLWQASTDRFDARLGPGRFEPYDRRGTIHDRIERLVAERTDLFGRAGPVWRVALREGVRPTDPRPVAGRAAARAQVAELFVDDLAARDEALRERTIDAVATVSDFLHWEHLRLLGRSEQETTAILRHQVRSALLDNGDHG